MVIFNFFVRLVLVIAVMIFWQVPIDSSLLFFPFAMASLLLTGFAIGLALTPLAGLYGDIGRGIPIIAQFWMLLTPVVYPARTEGLAGWLATWNPISPLITTARECLTAQPLTLLPAFWIVTACAAVVLGTMAAMVMTRFRSFRGKTLFSALITAPLVMPEVITGLSMLLLFVSLGDWFGIFQQRSVATMWIAHVTFTMAFVTVIISSRLGELDRSLEEAAMDLGANRLKVFFVITLPIIAPALLSGWLMAFTLSLDDLVISSFTSGPSSTTLPMKIFSSVRMGVSPKINALASLMILAVSAAALIAWWSMRRSEKRRQRDMQLALQQN